MYHQRRWVTIGLLLLLAVGGLLWQRSAAPRYLLQLLDRHAGIVLLEVPVAPGDTLALELEHSFEHVPWHEYYTITPDGQFLLEKIAVGGYGAGIPAEMDVPTYLRDGLVWMEEIDSLFPQLKWITSDTYMKGLCHNGEEIFDFRQLPDSTFVLGTIIKIKGGPAL